MTPSLSLNFRTANGIDPRVKFTRADVTACATYVNHEGFIKTITLGLPRFTHDPVTKRRLGLLLEEPRTNDYIHSEDLSNGAWVKTRSVVSAAPSIVAPDGSTNTWKLAVDASNPNTSRFIGQSVTTSVGLWYGVSFFVKAAEKSWAYIEFSAAAFGTTKGVYFDLSNGAIGTYSSDMYPRVIPHGNGWYRICVTAQAKATVTASNTISLYIGDADGDTTIAEANGSSGIYVWGAQLEQENTGGTYQATNTAQAGTSNTITLAAAAASTTTYSVAWCYISSGTGAGQLRQASAYDTSTKVMTVSSNWSVIPDATSVYQIYRHSYLNTTTSYIKTTGSPVSRAADELYSDGAEFSAWCNGQEGTLVVTYSAIGSCNYAVINNNVSYVAYIHQSTTDFTQMLHHFDGSGDYPRRDDTRGGSVTVAQNASGRTFGVGVEVTNGVTFSPGSSIMCVNGEFIGEDTASSVFTPTQIYFSGTTSASRHINSYVSSIKFYPYAVDKQTLQSLTRDTPHGIAEFSFNAASERISSAFTFTRADATTCATYFGKDGLLKTVAANVPRFEYDPATGEFRGLLIERSTTNRFRNNYATVSGGTISTGTVLAPDGSTAMKFVPTAGTTNYPQVGNSSDMFTISLTQGQTTYVSVSGWFKNIGAQDLRPFFVIDASVSGASNNYATMNFNASSGSVAGFNLGTCWTEYETPKITLHPNGMYRVTWSLMFTQDATIRNQIALYVQCRDSVSSGIYTADGSSGFQLFGIQLENLYTATSYVVTTSAAVARAGDILSQSVGVVSDWYNDDEGTWVIEGSCFVIPPIANTWPKFFTLKDSTNTDRFTYYINAIDGEVSIYTSDTDSVTSVFSNTTVTPIDDTPFKTAATFARGGSGVLTMDGAYLDSVINFTELVTAPNQFTIGANVGNTDNLLGHIRSIRYYPYKLSNLDTQQISDYQNKSGANTPTLSFNFAQSKRLDQRFTFARADASSCATYFDNKGVMQISPANTPRFTHDPLTHKSLGLMMEEAGTNFLKASKDVSNSTYWIVNNNITATANQAVAPNGLTEATKLTISGVYSDPYRGQRYNTGSSLANRTFTFSVWLWTDEGQPTNSNQIYLYDLSVGDVGAYTIPALTTTPTRYTITKTFGGAEADTEVVVRIDLNQSSAALGNYIYAWGAQLEEKEFATSFIPTTTTTVTRAEETCSMPVSGIINQREGTFVVSGQVGRNAITSGSNANMFTVDGGAVTDRIAVRHVLAGLIDMYVEVGGVQQVDTAGISVVAGDEVFVVATYKDGDYAFIMNNGSFQTDTVASVPNMTTLFIGNGRSTVTQLNGTISKFAYYPKRLDNQTIRQLSA